jgi:predicted transport protein
MYIAYKLAKNFVCLATGKSSIVLWLKLDPDQVGTLPPNVRDMRNVGHHGTGDLEVNIKDDAEMEVAKPLIRLAFERAGG